MFSCRLERSGSIQTFDSLDWARYSDDGDKQVEDRIAGIVCTSFVD